MVCIGVCELWWAMGKWPTFSGCADLAKSKGSKLAIITDKQNGETKLKMWIGWLEKEMYIFQRCIIYMPSLFSFLSPLARNMIIFHSNPESHSTVVPTQQCCLVRGEHAEGLSRISWLVSWLRRRGSTLVLIGSFGLCRKYWRLWSRIFSWRGSCSGKLSRKLKLKLFDNN